MLERARRARSELCSRLAAALGRRYYIDSQYSRLAAKRCFRNPTLLSNERSHDPNLALAATQRIANRVERGDLARAYKETERSYPAAPPIRFGAHGRRLCAPLWRLAR